MRTFVGRRQGAATVTGISSSDKQDDEFVLDVVSQRKFIKIVLIK